MEANVCYEWMGMEIEIVQQILVEALCIGFEENPSSVKATDFRPQTDRHDLRKRRSSF